MALWSSFYPNVVLAAPGCPNPLVDFHLRQASIEFFRRTRAWVKWLDPVITQSILSQYALVTPADTEIVRLEQATIDGAPCQVLNPRDLGKDTDINPLNQAGIISRDRKTFRYGAPLQDNQSVSIQVSLKPTQAALGIPDDQFNEYLDDISNGAKARILMTAGTDFYNPDLATVCKAAFESAIGTRSRQAFMGDTGRVPRSNVKWM